MCMDMKLLGLVRPKITSILLSAALIHEEVHSFVDIFGFLHCSPCSLKTSMANRTKFDDVYKRVKLENTMEYEVKQYKYIWTARYE